MRGDAIRLSFFYAAFFVFAGIHLPFWPVWLAAKGIDAEGIALIIAAGIVVKVAVNPLIAHFADRSGARRPIMLALVLGASVVFAAFFVAEGFTAILLVNLLFLALWAPVMPLGESLTLLAAR
ncbi:MAG: MFS transporter, partial [Alphaproteobacteria bacterium]|nr:MFS transporter [Alphaproteobacteria bacterium]